MPSADRSGARDVLDALLAAREAGRRTVLVTVVAVTGDVPSRPGAQLVVADGRPAAGGLGCAEFDAAGLALAVEVTDEQTTLRRQVVLGHGQEHVLDLFAQGHAPPATLLVCHDTPVGRAVADLGRFLGRRVELLDDPLPRLRARGLHPSDAVVVSDHDAADVDEVLRLTLTSDAGFVGMLGSRRHAPEPVARLRAAGVAAATLARLRAPLGLDVGSRTPPEIALSICAEVLAAERGRDGRRMGADHGSD